MTPTAHMSTGFPWPRFWKICSSKGRVSQPSQRVAHGREDVAEGETTCN